MARETWLGDKSHLPELGVKHKHIAIEAIFGIYDLLSSSFAAVVTESEPFVSEGTIHIRRVKKISIIPLFQGSILSQSKKRDEEKYLELLNNSFVQHQFFYSLTYELTHTQQRMSKFSQHDMMDPMWSRAENIFFWNRDLLEDLISSQADDWIVPFMSAYIEFQPNCKMDDDTGAFGLLFISRRGKSRQGCRFTKRGIDENGNVANYVETEQIALFQNGKITSFVQIRGSIPLLWSSPVHMRYEPAVYISEHRGKSVENFEKHIKNVVNSCSDASGNCDVVFVNLIDGKKDQGRLGVAFSEVVDSAKSRISVPMRYIWFDFHKECAQKGKWANLSKLVKQVDKDFRSHGFFCRNPTGVVGYQNGVIRTNCMDNLDRTNVVQSLFARRSLLIQMGKSDLLENGNVLQTPFKKFEDVYKSMWVNNANAISLMYAGTGALKVDFTKTGKRTFKGMISDGVNSCKRYYINNFTDGFKQDGIDLMLGRYKPHMAKESPFIPRQGQESVEAHFLRAFVLMMSIFFIFVLLSPILDRALLRNDNSEMLLLRLSRYFIISLQLTITVSIYMVFVIVKKGSKLGDLIVTRPCLCSEIISN